ncbi:fungal-specific transcription factor domain-containing protein [Lentinula detonsa]|uniref:Fungal-specific transcription factor domain-containing protein n=1 Tax=Lentinula detonsa TaxID=2804962 RepID=A0A9W8TVB1_9AGAR|nr:fungal-specific transcription factor domain-containing protein [Lentinula detonsa]
MADSEDSNGPSSSIRPRKRRALRACNQCKKRKVRCDGATMPNNICSSCISLDLECEYSSEQKRRGPKSKLAQPQLRNDVQALVSTILSAPRLVVVPSDEALVRDILVDLATYARRLEQQLERALVQPEHVAQSPSSYSTPTPYRPSPLHTLDQSEDKKPDSISLQVKKIGLDRGDQSYQRHVGSSSHFILLQTALEIRNEMSSEKEKHDSAGKKRNEVWNEFWIRQPWHRFPPEPEDPPYVFPPDDLLRNLISLYFDLQHNIYPLLHRQIFEREVYINKLHTTDRRFGAVVLAVCALGSRLSNDPRNLFNGTTDERSLGWRYFNQIRLARTNFVEHPTLFEVQTLALALLFIFPTPIGDAGWSTCGLAIRFVLEVGAHREQHFVNKGKQNRIEAELWRRAFWYLVTTDLVMSIALGRPRSIREDDFDLELPPECDDEYWEDPTNPFVQPEGQPSRMAFWHHNMELLRIAGLVKDHLYATRKAEPWLSSSPDSNTEIVIELDSALNSWLDALPDHLKWDPHHPGHISFLHLVMLHGNYYWVQIQAHKLFIRSDSLSTSSFPSLAICTNAARSFAHIIQAYHSRPNTFMLSVFIAPMFLSATMLLINTWTSLRAKSNHDPRKDMNDVSRILQILSVYERRYEMAGRVKDMLQAIVGFDHVPFPTPEKPSLKRSRPSQTPALDKNPSSSRPLMASREEREGERDSGGWSDFNTTQHSTGSERAVSAVRSSFQGDDIAATAPFVPVEPSGIPTGMHRNDWDSNGLMFDPSYVSFHAPMNMQVHEMPQQPPTSNYTDFGLFDTTPMMSYDSVTNPSFAVPVSSAWGDPGHEDWTAFISKVDDLLQFINPDGT